ncbi:MAG: Flp pilus assembly protein CpaB [Candidatus Omnitrophica bacterium]|nr:Flp pilus assembly protein CpaB [Candidatus Omnitrophota bacterium]
MALPIENKRQFIIITVAVLAGIASVVFMSNYVQTSISDRTSALAERYDAQQKEMATRIQQRADQQMAALAQELQNVKSQQSQELQKQVVALQQARQAELAALAKQKVETRPAVMRKPSLALKTPAGKRAVTIKIDSLAAVGGLINPGDFVDVIAQLNVPAQDMDKKAVTAMIFQGLQVLAVNTNEEDLGAYDEQQAALFLKITVAVDPQEAGLLAFAEKNGTMELALRSPNDTDHTMVKANTWKTLTDYVLKNQGLDIQNPDGDNAEKPEEHKPSIQIFRGGKEL